MLLALLLALAEPPRVQAARAASAAHIQELFAGKRYPPRRVLLRAFKAERTLELWAGDGALELIRSYPICASSGAMGPKRQEGDGQVPEGFYQITQLNPSSQFLLSMRVNYPNASDRILGRRPLGGDIFIHGKCVTIGCIPIEDGPIQELFVIATDARAAAARIDAWIFPTREWARLPASAFWENLREGDALFERTHRLPDVTVDARGRYHFK